jgi:hypothetical protein
MAADEARQTLWTAPATARPTRRRLLWQMTRWPLAALKWLGVGLNILGGISFLPYTPDEVSPDPVRDPVQHLAMPAPGHPERLIPGVPPTAAERELWAQLTEIGQPRRER